MSVSIFVFKLSDLPFLPFPPNCVITIKYCKIRPIN